ncbi:hypothetical protein KNV35_gp73 [uncultured phage cr8_1]|uniref:Uncharacterized protein n=1 Tax=uncultured phage cr8_1 TaxID=2772068 RepID=A0A7M1RY90_9CAUD|nr:hypothetical protein KNV35_gp73 [uncultured phage cr8_1]QOR58862.1 hypothetical protein [uncultured phage cr8_1]
MDDFNQVNQIISDAIKDSSYITVLISSGVYILYTLIIRLVDLFKAKDRNKPLIQMASAIKEVSENVVKLNTVLDNQIQDAESKELTKVRQVISLAFDSFRANISKTCNEIIIHNNIEENRDLIRENLFKTISTEYYKLYNVFSAYEVDGINIATKIKDEWIDDTTKECLEVIYDGQDKDARIGQIINKLTIIANEHSVYVNNKVFNH